MKKDKEQELKEEIEEIKKLLKVRYCSADIPFRNEDKNRLGILEAELKGYQQGRAEAMNLFLSEKEKQDYLLQIFGQEDEPILFKILIQDAINFGKKQAQMDFMEYLDELDIELFLEEIVDTKTGKRVKIPKAVLELWDIYWEHIKEKIKSKLKEKNV